MIYGIDDIKKILSPIFELTPVYKAILFGSYAKGTATEQSDIDLVLDSHGDLRGLDFYGALEDIGIALDKKVDLFDMSEIGLGSPIMDEITQHGVVIYERQK